LIVSQSIPGLHAGMAAIMPGLVAQREVKSDYAHLEEDIVEYGMPASLKVPALERPLAGHVKMVSSVASSTDWMSSDVKVYQTLVNIDEPAESLKPNMSAEVTVKIAERKNVLRLPIQAVLESGGKKFCYVKTPTAIEKRFVKTGLNNYKFVEIMDGSEVKEKDVIVLNARSYAEKVGDLQGNVSIDPSSMIKDRGGRGKRPEGTKGGPGKLVKSPGTKPGTGAEKPANVSAEPPSPTAPPKSGAPKDRSAAGAGS
jgi:hypothetical protein